MLRLEHWPTHWPYSESMDSISRALIRGRAVYDRGITSSSSSVNKPTRSTAQSTKLPSMASCRIWAFLHTAADIWGGGWINCIKSSLKILQPENKSCHIGGC